MVHHKEASLPETAGGPHPEKEGPHLEKQSGAPLLSLLSRPHDFGVLSAHSSTLLISFIPARCKLDPHFSKLPLGLSKEFEKNLKWNLSDFNGLFRGMETFGCSAGNDESCCF